MTRVLLALAFWLHLGIMLALMCDDPRQLTTSAKLRTAAASALVAGAEAWCAVQPFGSAWRVAPLVPAVLASYATWRPVPVFRDARGATSYVLALSSALVLREFALTADSLAGGLGVALAFALPLVAERAWARHVRARYLALQDEMPGGWLQACAVCSALLSLVYLLACVPTPVATRPQEYPQVLLALALAPLAQASVLGTLSGHFALLQARERERLLRLSSERMAEAVRRAAEGERVAAIRRHDLRHHMAALDELLASGETERARAYVRALAQGGDL